MAALPKKEAPLIEKTEESASKAPAVADGTQSEASHKIVHSSNTQSAKELLTVGTAEQLHASPIKEVTPIRETEGEQVNEKPSDQVLKEGTQMLNEASEKNRSAEKPQEEDVLDLKIQLNQVTSQQLISGNVSPRD